MNVFVCLRMLEGVFEGCGNSVPMRSMQFNDWHNVFGVRCLDGPRITYSWLFKHVVDVRNEYIMDEMLLVIICLL